MKPEIVRTQALGLFHGGPRRDKNIDGVYMFTYSVEKLLAAIDRGSWAEVLEARKAFE